MHISKTNPRLMPCALLLGAIAALSSCGRADDDAAPAAEASRARAAAPAPGDHAADRAPRVEDIAVGERSALSTDGRRHASASGRSEAESRRRIRTDQAYGGVIRGLRSRHAPRFAGLFLEDRPERRVVVRLTGKAPVPDEMADVEGERVPVVYRTGAAATEAAQMDAIERNTQALRKLLPGIRAIGPDARTGEIAIAMEAPADQVPTFQAMRPLLEGMLGQPVRLDFSTPRAQAR